MSSGRIPARSARVIRLQEHGRLKFISERGSTLIERGTAYGTYTATMVADLTIHSKSVTASVTIYPRGGSITGSGRYSHVAEVNHKPLGISGVINRYNFEVEVKASGEASGL